MKKRIIFTCLIGLLIFLQIGLIWDFLRDVIDFGEIVLVRNLIYICICLLVIAENIYLLIKLWKNKEDLTYQDYKEQRAKKQAEKKEKKKEELKKLLEELEKDE